MKVALVSEHASPLAVLGGTDAGGQNVHVDELASALVHRGHQVVVYTRRDHAGVAAQVAAPGGYTVTHLDAGPPSVIPKDELLPHLPTLSTQLAERLAHTPADVVHAHFWMSGLATLAAATRTPLVQTFHALGTVKRRFQGLTDTSPHERVAHERMIVRHAARVIASCRDECSELVRMGGIPSRIDVIPSGVDLALFTSDGPRLTPTGLRRVGVVSRLVPRKGVDDAIRAIAVLDNAELVVAGGPATGFDDDAEVRRLRSLARALDVADRVHLLGPVPRERMAAVLRSCDVVACLPWYEPFGLVPLEAMACGVPVVASAVGGLLDTVVDGCTGRHVRPRDWRSAAEAIRGILADPQRRRRMAAAGRARAASYSWEQVAAAVEHTYVDAVATARQEAVG